MEKNYNIDLNQRSYNTNSIKGILHNNINNNIITKQELNYKFFIDSYDKNYLKYPSPFKFIISFNDQNFQKNKTFIEIDDYIFIYSKYNDYNSSININKSLKNIISIEIKLLILPLNISYKTDSNGYYIPINETIDKYKYIILKIKELENNNFFSNNNNIDYNSFIMVKENVKYLNNSFWICINKDISYPYDFLKNINNITIEICNPDGDLLKTKLDNKYYDFNKDYRDTINYSIELKNTNKYKFEKEKIFLKKKLKILKKIIKYISPEIYITFKTIQPRIDTLPKFENI